MVLQFLVCGQKKKKEKKRKKEKRKISYTPEDGHIGRNM
jgi:hypothetical protein